MEEYILEYLFQQTEEDLIKGNDYPVLLYLIRESYSNCWQVKMKVKAVDASEDLGMSPPTFNSSLERLEFAGLIEFESFSGRKGYTMVKICFIDDMLSSRHFDEDSTKHEEKVLNDYAPRTKKMMETRILDVDREKNQEPINYKKVLEYMPLKYKDSLEYRVENIKKFYNLFQLNIKKFYNLDAKYKNSLDFRAPKYKISLHFMSTAKSLNISDLTEVSNERYRNLRSFFAKIGTIYSKKYINIINTIDLVLFDGKLFDAIENYIVEDKAQKGSSKYSSKEFEVTEETLKFIPLDLHNHKEKVLTDDGYREIDFLESYQNWLNYKKHERGEPVGYGSAKRNLQWLATLDNPIECIETSIRKEAKGIFQPSNYNKQVKGSNSGTSSRNDKVGNVKRFD